MGTRHPLCSFLHIPSQYNISVGERPRDDVRLIVFAVSHHVQIDLFSLYEDNLSSSGKALGVTDTLNGSGSIANAVEDKFC